MVNTSSQHRSCVAPARKAVNGYEHQDQYDHDHGKHQSTLYAV